MDKYLRYLTMKKFILLLIACLLVSCKTTKVEYVDREVVKYVKKEVHDTLKINTHDSIYHTILQKGDTVYSTKYVEHTRWRDKIVYRIDTVYKDSIQVQIKESTIVEKKIPNWCWFSLAGWAIILTFALIKIRKLWLT